MPACIFLLFPFRRVTFVLFLLFLFCFPISHRPPGPYCMWCARPNPAMPAAQLSIPPSPPCTAAWHGFEVLSGRSHQVGRSVVTFRRPRVLAVLREPTSCPPHSLLSHPSLARASTFLVCRFGKSNYPGYVIWDHGLSSVFTISAPEASYTQVSFLPYLPPRLVLCFP